MEPIIIIGAGAAGLMAAYELSEAGKQVILLEAGVEPGGRIRTLRSEGFPHPVEAGAEFIHGEMPLTFSLLKRGSIEYKAVGGRFMQFRNGEWVGDDPGPGGWDELMQKMEELKEDVPLAKFLETIPEEKFKALRQSIRRFAEGFDLADVETVSTRYLYREWQQEDETQYRIVGGYGRMIRYLTDSCVARGCRIHTSSPVTELIWSKGKVAVRTASGENYPGKVFHGAKVIVTVSPAILQNFGFFPSPDAQIRAARKIGYGTITKVLLQFSTAFWADHHKDLGFVISDEAIPTWWTQYPDPNPLLTGWIPGAVMKGLGGKGEAELISLSLASLSSIFAIRPEVLQRELLSSRVVDWSTEPFILGGYSFDTLESVEAKHVLNHPVEDTLYFAGEALYTGPAPGTVEAALASGKEVAGKIISARHP